MNNSDQEIKWGLDLRSTNKAIEEGVFKFVHPSGAPFVNMTGEETKGIEGTLKPGETQQVAVMFCPSKYLQGELLLCHKFPPFNSKGDKYFGCLFSSLDDETFPKRGLLIKEIICSSRSKLFPFTVDPYLEGLQK